VHQDVPSRRSTNRRSVALALVVCPVAPSRKARLLRVPPFNLLSGRTGSTTATPCTATTRPGHTGSTLTPPQSVALALAVRPITVSRGSTTRHLVAPALLCLCCASERTVSPLDFLSVGSTSSRCVLDHSISRLDCAAAQLVVWSHWLYFSHAVRRDNLSHGNTDSTSTTLCAATTSPCGLIGSTSSTLCAAATSSSDCIASTTHIN
jgi:hypothetical protein